MACRIQFTVTVLFVLTCSLIYAVPGASSFEFNKDKESSGERRVSTESEKAIFYCTEVDFPEDIICDMTNTTSGRDEWKDLVPRQDSELVLSNSGIEIIYRFTGGDRLKRYKYQYVRLYPVDYEPPTRDVKMDEFSYLRMQTEKFLCVSSIEFIRKISGKLGENGSGKRSSLMEYKFVHPDVNFCPGLITGRIVKDFFKAPCVHDGRRCRPRKN